MLSIKKIVEDINKETIAPEAWVNKNDISKTCLHLLEDLNYQLERYFNVKLTPAELCEEMDKAIYKYKNYK